MKLFNRKRDIIYLLLVCILCASVFIGYKTFRIDGTSMQKSYESGDVIIVNKVIYNIIKPNFYDIIVFYDIIEDDILIKRVIGIEGDSIELKKGEIYINDTKLTDEFSESVIVGTIYDEHDLPLTDWESGELILLPVEENKLIVPKDHVWVIGDNRAKSWYGLIHINDIIGKVID